VSIRLTRPQIARGTTGATFGSTPTVGNLLCVTSCERSDTTLSIGGSGWTERISNVLTGNATYRRSIKMWTKIAGASEPTAITVTNGVATIAEEFAYPGGDFGAHLESVSANNGNNDDGTSVSTGTLGSQAGLRMERIVAMSREGRGASSDPFAGPDYGAEEFAFVSQHRRYAGSTGLYTGLFVATRVLFVPTSSAVTLGFSGANTGQSAGITAFRLVGDGERAGKVTLSAANVEGARVYVVNQDELRLEGYADTDASGDWSVDVTDGDDYIAAVSYENGGTKYTAPGQWGAVV
jgi:hypothetical protein